MAASAYVECSVTASFQRERGAREALRVTELVRRLPFAEILALASEYVQGIDRRIYKRMQ
jgi:hypothetical protein